MKSDTVIYFLNSQADANACVFALTKMTPPYVVDVQVTTGQAFTAAYMTNAYAPGVPPDWSKLVRGNPQVYVVVASR